MADKTERKPVFATGFADIGPGLARLVLAGLALVMAALLAVALAVPPTPDNPEGRGDLGTYKQIVTRLQAGENYHQALHTELVAGGYGTRSVFNWRPPFFLEMIALLQTEQVSQAVLVTLSVLAVSLAGWVVLQSAGRGMAVAVAVALGMGQLAAIAPVASLCCELWAGALILVSVAAYGRGRYWLGFAGAFLALWMRELSGLYVLVALYFAWRAGRRDELAAWGIGLAVFGVYFAWHATTAMGLVLPTDPAYKDSWLQFGGAAFVLGTAQFNGLFLLMPLWVTALTLPLAVLGFLGWNNAAARYGLATVLAYALLFAFFGRSNNGYWGGLYAPLLMLGLPFGVVAVKDLVGRALWSDPQPSAA
jgi:hypothetical protein